MKAKLLLTGLCMMLCGMLVPAVNVCAQEQEETVEQITDGEWVEIQVIPSPIITYSTKYPLNWEVPGNITYATDYFNMSEGSSIGIVLTLTKSCDVGIQSYSGTFRYVTGKSINHSFKITESDKYKVCIRNKNSGSVTTSGYYRK